MRSILSVTMFAVLFAFGCGGGGSGGGDDDGGDDAPAIDAPAEVDAPPSGVNALGQLCPFMAGGGGTECPAGNACVQITGVGTNTTTGYCTPQCMNMNAICTTGYTGPAGGMPVCALSPAQGQPPDGCAIICTDTPQCPTGMTCTAAGNAKICVPT